MKAQILSCNFYLPKSNNLPYYSTWPHIKFLKILPPPFLASFLTTLCLILCLQLSSSVSLGQVQEIQSCCYCLVAELCPTLCNPMDCCPPGFSVHGILQGRILDRVAISFSRRSSLPRDWTYVSCIGRLILYPEPPGKPEIQSNGC